MPPENLPVYGGYQSEGPALVDKPVPEKWNPCILEWELPRKKDPAWN